MLYIYVYVCVCFILFLFYYLRSYYEHLHIATEKRAERQHQHPSQIKEYLTVCTVVSLIGKGVLISRVLINLSILIN